ncbi:MAG: YdcF family protein [Candidatus Solibacter usitatus]|nr:YdcF family protein [Candidatus Solibacter usitatus]
MASRYSKRWFLGCAGALLLGIAVHLLQLTLEIDSQSTTSELRPADLILVLGAAEYRGKPSPVLRARLDHAFDIYNQGIAKKILTTGGAGGDPVFTEGEVGRTYLSRKGVPVEDIIVEAESESTAKSLTYSAEIMRRMGLRSCVIVSDGYHIFRARKMLRELGIEAYGAPRPTVMQGKWAQFWLCFRQAVGYDLWVLGIRV